MDENALVWFYAISGEEKPVGPLSLRDLDVFIRTNIINSNTYVWKEGFKDWQKIFQIEELKELITNTNSEVHDSIEKNKILTKAQKGLDLYGENFFLGGDGYWNVYDAITKKWRKQEEKPVIHLKESTLIQTNNPNIEMDTLPVEEQEILKEIEKQLTGEVHAKITEMSEEVSETAKASVSKTNSTNQNNNKNNNTTNKDLNLTKNSDIFNKNADKSPIDKVLASLSPKDRGSTSKSEVNLMDELLKKKRSNPNLISVNPKKEKVDEKPTAEKLRELEKKQRKKERKKEKSKQKWYNAKINSTIYISGLPKDITLEEFTKYFSRCGCFRKDAKTNLEVVKLYKDDNGILKGDGIISFLKPESVDTALDMLNETEIKPGYKIKIDMAKFEQKGDYHTRETYKIDDLERFRRKTEKQRALGWAEADEEKGLKIINNPTFRKELELDIVEECESSFGEIDKIKIFDEHEEGIVKIKFILPSAAEKAINHLNGRFYNERKLDCFYWDGKTEYNKPRENPDEERERIEEFGKWLEGEGEGDSSSKDEEVCKEDGKEDEKVEDITKDENNELKIVETVETDVSNNNL